MIILLVGAVSASLGWFVAQPAAPSDSSFALVMIRPEDGGTHHKAITGEPVKLKAVARAAPGTRLTYQWDFGDGTDPERESVDDYFNVGAEHTYQDAKVGDDFTATLTVTNRETGQFLQGEYRIRFTERTAANRIDVAVGNGLWALHVAATRADSPTAGPTLRWEERRQPWRAGTALNVYAYHLLGHRPSGNGQVDPYVEDVRRALNALLQDIEYCGITAAGRLDPDTNGNGKGLRVLQSNRQAAETAFLLLALASSRAPDERVFAGTPRDIARDDEELIDGLTYREAAQEMVDYLAFAQSDDGDARGGWMYQPNGERADMAATGWVVLSLIAAESTMAGETPGWVREELLRFLETKQHQDGAFGFAQDDKNVAATAAGIISLGFCDKTSEDDCIADAREMIGRKWGNDNVGNYQTMYAISQAAQLATTRFYKFGEHKWRDEYRVCLLESQGDDGLWQIGGRHNQGAESCTALALLVLKDRTIDLPRSASGPGYLLPLAIAAATLLLGLVYFGWIRRKRSFQDTTARDGS